MKRSLIFLLPLLLLSASCEKDKDKEKTEKFSVYPDKLDFPAGGDTETIEVTLIGGNGPWKAITQDEWIKLDYTETSGSGVLTVKVEAAERFSPQNGSITVSTDNKEDIVIPVTQKPYIPGKEPEHSSLRSSWSRMNLKGYVHKLGSYIDYTTGRMELKDLEFDKYGMLTGFKAKDQLALREGNYFVEYDTDDPSRIIRISGNTPYNPDQFILEFQYGDHDKYIATEDLFFQLDNQGTYTMWRMWLPRLVKNLERVVFVQDLKPDVEDMEMYYEITGDTGELWVSSTVYGEPSSQAFQWLTFSGDYPIEVNYLWAGMGFPMNYYSFYDINTENGYFNSYALSIEKSFNWIERSFNADGCNSYSSLMDYDLTGDVAFQVTYNDKGDRITFGPNVSFDYIYDEQGNWTKVTITGDGEPRVIERTVEYKD